MKTSRTFLRDCTVISPLALLLFGGPLDIAHAGGYVSLDHFRVGKACDMHRWFASVACQRSACETFYKHSYEARKVPRNSR